MRVLMNPGVLEEGGGGSAWKWQQCVRRTVES